MDAPGIHNRIRWTHRLAPIATVLSALSVVWAVYGAASMPCVRFIVFFPVIVSLSCAGIARALGNITIAQFCGGICLIFLISANEPEFNAAWLCANSSDSFGLSNVFGLWGVRAIWGLAFAHLISRLPWISSSVFLPLCASFVLGIGLCNFIFARWLGDVIGFQVEISDLELGVVLLLGAGALLAGLRSIIGKRILRFQGAAWLVVVIGLTLGSVSWTILADRESLKREQLARTYLDRLQRDALARYEKISTAIDFREPAPVRHGRRKTASAPVHSSGDLHSLLSSHTSIRAFHHFDSNKDLKDTNALLMDPLHDQRSAVSKEELIKVFANRSKHQENYLKLSNDRLALVVFPEKHQDLTLAGLVDRRSLASELLGFDNLSGVNLAVDDDIDTMFFGRYFRRLPSLAIALPGTLLPWVIHIDRDSPRFMAGMSAKLPETFFAILACFTFLAAILVQYMETLRSSSFSVRRMNAELRESEEQLKHRAVELMEARESALYASRMKTQFLAHLSHEIRTPLNAIVTAVELLAESVRGQKDKTYAITAVEAAETVVELLNETLDIARIEGGNIEIHPTVYSPRKLAESCGDLFGSFASKSGVKIETKVAKRVPEFVFGDLKRVRQILTNLIGNSMKYTPKGFVRLEIEVEQIRGKQAVLRFVVQDTGLGIPGDEIPGLFHPFTRGVSTENLLAPGTGLGLSISRLLVEKLNGTKLPSTVPNGIQVQSTVGQGTRFWFFLAVDVSSAELGPKPRRRRPGRRKPVSVLLVEDNEISRKVTGERLSSLGYRVTEASSGEEALEKFMRKPYEVILMDCRLPGESGYETSQRMRNVEEDAGRPRSIIIALTASAFAEDRAKCKMFGMDDYLSKPFRSETLTEKIYEHLDLIALAKSDSKKHRFRPQLRKLMDRKGASLSEELFQMFVKEVPARFWALRELKRAHQADAFLAEVHALKGIFADLGYEGMSKRCESLETCVDEKGWAKTPKVLDQLESDYRREVERWKQSLHRERTAA